MPLPSEVDKPSCSPKGKVEAVSSTPPGANLELTMAVGATVGATGALAFAAAGAAGAGEAAAAGAAAGDS